MKILSIDVGMKNLAFCLFHIKDSMEFEILKWDVLNLCEERMNTPVNELKGGMGDISVKLYSLGF